METNTKTVIRSLAQANLRGITTERLVYDLQESDDRMETEADEQTKYFYGCLSDHIKDEFLRRENLKNMGFNTTSREIILTIKSAIPIQDVIGWYGEVNYYKQDWRFRCKAHGAGDKHPSGKIYPDEGRWHCFGCNVGGDVFDAVQHYEKTDMAHALFKLAAYIGLNAKPIHPKRGGANVGVCNV
tara:strand:+ start:937 stop:1491 length:555 start_codon:yes stop_codon:yes gene_type:complete